MSTERDTHFKEFARLLWEEMLSQTEYFYIDVTAGHIPLHHPEDEEHQHYIQVIARRVYDLAVHLFDSVDMIDIDMAESSADLVSHTSDMAAFPEQP